VLLLCAVVVLYASSFEEPRKEQPSRESPPTFTKCKCKPEIEGQQLVASLCQAPTNLGPWLHECVYAKEKQQ
jgi:hypothetical protein